MSIPPGIQQVTGAASDSGDAGDLQAGHAADPDVEGHAERGTPEGHWAFANSDADWGSLCSSSKHERILCAAGRVFSTQGLDAPMPAVAAAAGAGVGSLYRQFPSKHELLAALVVRRLDHIGEAAHAAAAAPAGSHWHALKQMLWMVVQDDNADDFLGEAIAIVSEHPDVADAMTRAQDQIDAMLRLTMAEGKLRSDASMLDLRLLFAATRAARRVEPDAWQRMLTLIIDGLRAQN
jgi:AcrR family transcriptional regulator